MKKSILAIAVLAATGLAGNAMAAPIADGVLTFNNNPVVAPTDGFFTNVGGFWAPGAALTPIGAANNTAFGVDMEFRMIGIGGGIGAGGEKSIVNSDIDWGTGFGGFVISSTGDITPGCPTTAAQGCLGPVQGGFHNATINTLPFGFALDPMIPVTADVNLVEGGALTIGAASVQAQWGGIHFPLGEYNDNALTGTAGGGNEGCNSVNTAGCGFNMSGTISNLGMDGSFDFILRGEHIISPYEDTAGYQAAAAGFAGWNAQFQVAGHFTPTAVPIPVPAAVWLFGSGMLGLVGVARRKKAA